MTVAIIPARGGSKRIPHKNLIDFCGRPLIYWSIKQALDSKLIDRVYVSTEDEEIAQVAKDYGADIIKRPVELAQDNSTLEEMLAYTILHEELKWDDTIVILQPTSPLRLPNDIDNCIKLLDTSYSVLSCNVENDLYLWDHGAALTFNYLTRKLYDYYERENGSIYAIARHQFLNNRYTGIQAFYPMQKWQSFEIDEPEDIEICEYFMKKKILDADGN